MKDSHSNITDWIDEYHNGVRYGLKGKVLINKRTPFQQVTIIDTQRYGKALLLDSKWMTAEKQEKHYHECLVHPALSSAHSLQNILIIGGGDGGTARECLRYEGIKQIDLVEIDIEVINLSKKYLAKIGQSAWSDPRLNVEIQDGIAWVNNTSDSSYDVVIIDGSDPEGPAEGLFNQNFFENCKRILRPGGVFATQSESPEAFRQVHIDTVKTLRQTFEYADPMYGWVPMYPSGWWSWTFAAKDNPRYLSPLLKRAKTIEKSCEIWSVQFQKGAFQAMPAFIEKDLLK